MNTELNKKMNNVTEGLDIYEIFVYNDKKIPESAETVYAGMEAGTVSGWQIKWVYATDEGVKTFPFFDCIISKNDCPRQETRKAAIIWK